MASCFYKDTFFQICMQPDQRTSCLLHTVTARCCALVQLPVSYIYVTDLKCTVTVHSFFACTVTRRLRNWRLGDEVVFVHSFFSCAVTRTLHDWRPSSNCCLLCCCFYLYGHQTDSYTTNDQVVILHLFLCTCTVTRQLHDRRPGVEVVLVARCHWPPACSLHSRLLHHRHHHPRLLCYLRYRYVYLVLNQVSTVNIIERLYDPLRESGEEVEEWQIAETVVKQLSKTSLGLCVFY